MERQSLLQNRIRVQTFLRALLPARLGCLPRSLRDQRDLGSLAEADHQADGQGREGNKGG